MRNNGLTNEKNIINSINNKLYSQVNSNLQTFLKFIFNDIDYNDKIFAKKISNSYKSDIKIRVGNIERNISIKSGSENSIHVEKIESFVEFLENININNKIINYLRMYHYGDDTYDGSGAIRFSAEQAKNRYFKEIMAFNKYISYDDILDKIIERFLFSRTKKENRVDYIYYGNENFGVWAFRDEIKKYLIKNKCYHIKTIHFSSLTYQNWCRNINRSTKSENHRNYIQVKWFSIVSDLEKIRRINY